MLLDDSLEADDAELDWLLLDSLLADEAELALLDSLDADEADETELTDDVLIELVERENELDDSLDAEALLDEADDAELALDELDADEADDTELTDDVLADDRLLLDSSSIEITYNSCGDEPLPLL